MGPVLPDYHGVAVIKCAWCGGLVWPWQDTAPRIFNGKIVEMHLACAAYSIVIEVKAINRKLAKRAEEIARQLAHNYEPLTKTKAY